jgi:diaminohydroxyphosphoribosylaminopyrimidine deaminase / 5-amino-6-(5-phosphoribosylamino)uracil reductase
VTGVNRAQDERLMRQAIALAQARLGQTGDNPAVGCVIAYEDGSVAAEGETAPAGRPHAEELALAMAGAAAFGATAYVTLEPCAERSAGGRSCAQLLIDAQVARVVVAATDPSPYAAGRGLAALRTAGIEVESGLLAAEAEALYADYRRRF